MTCNDHFLNPGEYYTFLNTVDITITAGHYYDYFFYLKSDDAVGITISLVWDISDPTMLGTVYSSLSWSGVPGTVQAPAGATKVHFYFRNSDPEASSFVWHLDIVEFNYPSTPEFSPTIMLSVLGIAIYGSFFLSQKKDVII